MLYVSKSVVPYAAGQTKSMSLPASTTSDASLLKMHASLLIGKGNMGSLLMPGTPSLPNLPSRASVSPTLSPQACSSQNDKQHTSALDKAEYCVDVSGKDSDVHSVFVLLEAVATVFFTRTSHSC